MRPAASILHLDLDAFYAAVEQRDKPSLRGKPVVVGGVGPRGVVATASYEARTFGIRSAMSTAEARSRCPHAAFLVPRFDVYRVSSEAVMGVLRSVSPVIEPLSLDEAFVDLAAADPALELDLAALGALAAEVKRRVVEVTEGLTASVGIASSKLVAKIASELDKPDGARIVAPGSEQDLLRPMSVKAIPGVGPATAGRLAQLGVTTVAELEALTRDELVRVLGRAHGGGLHALARAIDDRAVVADRETKSVSVEDTFDTDLVDPALLAAIVDRHARQVAERLARARLSGCTVTLKVRHHDFATQTRSTTLKGPTDRGRVLSAVARELLAELDTSAGVRLLGVGVSSLTDWVQDDLFQTDEDEAPDTEVPIAATVPLHASAASRGYRPGLDVVHDEHGAGWVWGAGRGRVTVRFEMATTEPGPIRTFADDDERLHLGRE